MTASPSAPRRFSRPAIASLILLGLAFVSLVAGSALYSFAPAGAASIIFDVTLAAIELLLLASFVSAAAGLIEIRRRPDQLRGGWLAVGALLLSLISGILVLSAAMVGRLCCAPP